MGLIVIHHELVNSCSPSTSIKCHFLHDKLRRMVQTASGRQILAVLSQKTKGLDRAFIQITQITQVPVGIVGLQNYGCLDDIPPLIFQGEIQYVSGFFFFFKSDSS
jgi:hypothetical protein